MSLLVNSYAKPVDLIRSLQMNGLLASLVEQRFSQIRNEQEWYKSRLRTEGFDKAEAFLKERFHSTAVFGNNFEKLALSMADFSEHSAGRDDLYYVLKLEKRIPYVFSRGQDGGYLILCLNPEQQGCGCTQVKGSGVFGLYGDIGLIGVLLRCIPQYRGGYETALQLIFKTFKHPDNQTGYTVFDIGRDGFGLASNLYHISGDTSYGCEKRLLLKMLGITSSDVSKNIMCMSTGLDGCMFPGAEDYLAKHFEKLPMYLSAVANNARHAH